MPPRDANTVVYVMALDAGGHRLAYVAAVVEAASAAGCRSVLLTLPEVSSAAEFQTHLGELKNNGVLEIVTDNGLRDARGRSEILRRLRRQGASLIVPDSDKFLVEGLLAKVVGRLPRRTSLVVMRPPAASWRNPRALIVAVVKVTVLLALKCFRGSVSVNLLEDPLAQGNHRVWKSWRASLGTRIDDPADLAGDRPTAPDELATLSSAEPIIAVVGSIDARKNLPLILEAWSVRDRSTRATLAVAGRIAPEVHAAVDGEIAMLDDVCVIDRYLSNDEMLGIVERAAAILVLYDGGLSSGVLVMCASTGRWVICAHGTRTLAVAARHGFAFSTELSAEALAHAMSLAVQQAVPPSPVKLAGRAEFGAQLVESAR